MCVTVRVSPITSPDKALHSFFDVADRKTRINTADSTVSTNAAIPTLIPSGLDVP